MKNFVRFIMVVLLCSPAIAGPADVFRQIRITVPDREALARVLDCGIDPCGVSGKVGGLMEFVAGVPELEQLAGKGIAYQTVVEDLASWYSSRMSPVPENALGFGYGSMGGYYTLAEVNQQLDSMRLLYPSIITARESVGTTGEGRVIWAVKISDNPGVDEPGEPEVLTTALHHAREPQGMMAVLYYMWWLLQNYGGNAEATYLVDNRELWFIPVVNPDGYFYNQSTNPTGGGMWRKNRRNNGGSYGVDLNRNYGPTYMWNASNGGSSTTPSSDTYRGPSPFSEPEISAINAFIRSHDFATALNYHTYSNLLIYPWGYLSRESADSLLFRDLAYDMTAINRYTTGTDLQTVGYATRGNSDDFMYGDSTKPRVYAMTPEVGSTGFWPTLSEILPLAVENLQSTKLLAYAAGFLPRLRAARVLEADSNGSLTAGEPFVLSARYRNIGVGAASNLTVEATSDAAWLTFTPSTVVVGGVAAQAEQTVLLQGLVDSLAPAAAQVRVFLRSTDTGGFEQRDTVLLFAGQPSVLFADSARTGTSNWSTGSGWGTTAQAHTPPFAFTDSPSGNYAANANNALTMLGTVNLGSYQFAQLRFWTRWAIEPTWDFATVELSTNGGSTWVNLRTEASRPGSARSGGQQPAGVFGYDASPPGLTWIEQSADLTAWAGRQIKIRFRLASDGGEERDGVYVDDIRIIGYSTTTPPPAPQLVSPADGAAGLSATVVLRWRLTAGAGSYRVQLSPDSLFGSFVLNDSTVTDTSRSVAGLASGVRYFWRVRARNGAGYGPVSAVYRFTTEGATTRSYAMQQFWNLVSLPQAVPDPSAAAVFPQASSALYAFSPEAGYTPADTLRGALGYWVKFDSAVTVELTGVPVTADTVPVAAGWNLIGSISQPIDTAAVVQVPQGLLQTPFYGYDAGTGYAPADSLRPARGYWVKAGQAGGVILQSAGAAAARRKGVSSQGGR